MTNDHDTYDETDDEEPTEEAPGRRRTYRSMVVVVLMLLIVVGTIGMYQYHGSLPLKAAWVCGLGLVLGSIYLLKGEKLPDWVYAAKQKQVRSITRDDDPSNLPLPVVLGSIAGAILIALALFGLWYLGVIF